MCAKESTLLKNDHSYILIFPKIFIFDFVAGKTPYMKKPSKAKVEKDEDQLAFEKKQREEAAKIKELQAKAAKGGPLVSGGIKRS